MDNLISIFVDSVFVGNILLAYFLGMCSYLSVSKNLQTSFGLGMAVIFVLAITTPVNWLVYHYLLAPGALAWAGFPQIDLRYLKLVLFIAVIAGMVQMVEMVIDRYSQALYNALGVFLPLITVNCAILGASLFMVERQYSFNESVVYGIGAGIGAIFKAPLGGALLSAEILYIHDLEVEALIPGLIASIVGYSVFGAFFGYEPIFGSIVAVFDQPIQLVYYAVLGGVCGLMGILYAKSFYGTHEIFRRISLSWPGPTLGSVNQRR